MPSRPASIPLSLVLVLLLAACGTDDEPGGGNGGTGPPPPGPDLSIHFSVHQEGTTERLLWKGTAEGPDADSPQRTARPAIPAAEPFRVDWELVDDSVTILGYQYRVTQDSREGDRRMPRDGDDLPYWGSEQSFSFENSTPLELIGSRCPTGGDCPERLLFTSDVLHSISVYAGTSEGEETPVEEALLEFEIVNEPPNTQLVQDGSYPYWHMDGVAPQALAAGDTIPAGAKVVFKLTGEDPDPVVLKAPLPRVRFQGLYRAEERSGPAREFSTFYSEPAEADTIEFAVGPFRYTFSGRAVDRLRAVDPTPESFQFDAGFAPILDSNFPGDADVVLLRRPTDGNWPQNTVDYSVPSPSVQRYWLNGKFYDQFIAEAEEWTGAVFRVPLEIAASPDPREPSVGGFGNARAFAYEWVSENDPDNSIADQGVIDNLSYFDDATASNRYRLEGETGIEIFVPVELWQFPSWFEEGSCSGAPAGKDYCGVGEYLRMKLGRITLTSLARQTARHDEFSYSSMTVEGQGSTISIEIGEWGLVSEALQSSFPVHIGLDDGSGGVLEWPPPSP